MSELLPLKIAIATRGHTVALKDGRVFMEGVKAEYIEVDALADVAQRMVHEADFDVCEMALATYLIARSLGAPLIALPVFVGRRFHHGDLLVRLDKGIRSPRDLEGRRVGVPADSGTASVWTRGMLQNDYGVDLDRVTWVIDGEAPLGGVRLPPNVARLPAGESMESMMASGEIQALFTGSAGIGRSGARSGSGKTADPLAADCRELFDDVMAEEVAWFKRTGIYPIQAVVVLREALLTDYPQAARTVFGAFVNARQIYLDRLMKGGVQNDADRDYRRLARIVGDPLPYGVDDNLPAIQAFMMYCHQQNLLPRQYAVDDMFVDARAL